MTKEHLFYDTLKSVSRSFYLSLRVLPARVRPSVSLAYLLCRTADSIADTNIIPWADRLQTLRRFRDLFHHFPIPAEPLKLFITDLNYANTIPQTREGHLLRQFETSVAMFNAVSKTEQAFIQEVVQCVIKGMEIDLTTFGNAENNLRALPTTDDLEEYIQLIGGEPGRFWCKVLLEFFPKLNIDDREKWIGDGVAFGKGLQMVNILRDLPQDIKEGRCYIPYEILKQKGLSPEDLLDETTTEFFLPLYHELIDDAANRLKHGLSYIRAIPARYWQLRISVWWPLAIGIKTLSALKASRAILNSDVKPAKIARCEIYLILLQSIWMILSDWMLERKISSWVEN